MILSYRDDRARRLRDGYFVREYQSIRRQAVRRLALLDAADSLADLGAIGGNNLESLRGDRRAQFSIRVNKQWRICFEWPSGQAGPSNVEIVDYH